MENTKDFHPGDYRASYWKRFIHTFSFFSVISYFLFFHVFSKYLFLNLHFDLIIVLPYTIFYRKRLLNFYNSKYFSIIKYTLIGLALWNIFSVIWGKFFTIYSTSLTGLAVSTTYLYMLIYFIYGSTVASNKKYINFKQILMIVSTAIIVISIYEYLNPAFADKLKSFYEVFEDEETIYIQGRFRVIGTLTNSNNLGLICAFLILLNLYTQGNVILRSAVIIAFIIVIFLTGSRVGFIVMSFVLLYYIFFIWTSKNIALLILTIIVLSIITVNYFDFENTILFRRYLAVERQELLAGRMEKYWTPNLKIIYNSPLAGVGRISTISTTTDNYYLNVIKTNGFIGLFLWLILIFHIGRFGLKNIFNDKTAKILFAIIIAILISSFTHDFYYSRYAYPIFFTFLGFYSYQLFVSRKQVSYKLFK